MRFVNIQVLRIVAAVAVLVFHLGIYFREVTGVETLLSRTMAHPSFSLGVPLFFAISGYVLTHSLQSTPPRRFLLLRVLRLYPAYLIPAFLVNYGVHRGKSIVWDESFWKAISLLPWGLAECRYPLHIEWTLVYEVAFSVLLTVVTVLVGVKKGLDVVAFLWLGVCLVRLNIDPIAEVYLPTWLDLPMTTANIPFLLGIFAYRVRERWPDWRVEVFVLSALLLVFNFATRNFALVQALGCAGAVWSIAASRPISSQSWLVWAGDRSYGLYLVHVVALLLFFHSAQSLALQPSNGLLALAGAFALTVGLVYGDFELRLYRFLQRKLLGTAIRSTAIPVANVGER